MRHSSLAMLSALSLALSVPASAQQAPEAPAAAPAPPAAPAPTAAPAEAVAPSAGPIAQVEPGAAEAAPPEPAPVAAPVAPAPSAPEPAAEPTVLPPAESKVESAAAPTTPAWTPVYTGSYFTRYEARTGYHDLGVDRPRFQEGDAIFYRARLGVGTGLIDTGSRLKVGLQATPQASGFWGAAPNTTTDVAFNLHEGYLRVQGQMVRADVGRFELNYGDSLVIGNLDWNETARSFDGARAHIAQSADSMWVDVFATAVHEGRLEGSHFADGDLYFMGAYAALGPALTQGLDLDAYALARVWPETTGLTLDATTTPPTSYNRKRAGEATFGARAKQKVMMFDYRVEAGLQAGSRPDVVPPVPPMGGRVTQTVSDVLAYHADLEVGVSPVPDKLRVSAEAIYASGNDDGTAGKNEGWDELYPTAHRWLGLSDVFALNGIKRTNVMSGVFHASSTPTPDLTIQADGHFFSRPEKVNGTSGFAGIEVDVAASYVLAKGLKLRGLYALFMPDSDMYPATPAGGNTDAAQFGEVELRYDL